MEKGIDKLLDYLKEEGMRIDEDLKKIINFFNRRDLVHFIPSGFGITPKSWEEILSEKTGIKLSKVRRIVLDLGQLSLLEEKRGMGTVVGRDYAYGFTNYARSIIEGKTKPEVTGLLKKKISRGSLIFILGSYLYWGVENGRETNEVPDECLTLITENPKLIDDELWKKMNNKIEGENKILIRRDDGTFEIVPK